MKNFFKILMLILSLTLVITAFAVVAAATEDEGEALIPKEIVSTTTKFKDGTFSSFTPGTVFQNALYNNKHKTGVWNIHATEDGNVYLQSEYEYGDSGANDNADFYFGTGTVVSYDNNLGAYPYVAFDFDVMTENGTYGNYASLAFCVYKDGTRVQELASTKFNAMGLSTVPYEWQHVTYVVESLGNGNFNHYFFINGELSYQKPTNHSTAAAFSELNGDFSKITLGYYRMYPSGYSDPSYNGKLGYDNFRFTLFPAGYCDTESGEKDFSKIATYIYDKDYELPYGITVAKVGDTVYDDANEAIDAAEAGETVKLTANATKTLVINKEIYLDLNAYDADGNATGTLYTYSYKTSSELVPVETAEGSGVFKFEKAAGVVAIITNSSGVVTDFSTQEELPTKVANIAAGSTITLIRDAIVTQISVPNKSLTIDLNGHTLTRQTTKVSKYNATLDENGEWVKGDLIETETVTSASGYLFYFGAYSTTCVFTVKSSRPGAVLGGATANFDQLISDGEVVHTESTGISGGITIFNFYPMNGTVNIFGENITFYMNSFVYAEHGGNGNEHLNIDGGTYVVTYAPAEGIFSIRNGEKLTFKNATFFCNGAELIRNASGDGNRNKNTEIVFENCEIYNAAIYSNAPTDKYTFNNCLLDASLSGGMAASLVIGENTFVTKDLISSYSKASLADGLAGETVSKKLYYNKLTKNQMVFDLENFTPTDEVTKNYSSVTFVYFAKPSDTETATVTWKNADGSVIATTEEFCGSRAFAPKTPWGDGYRGVLNASWVDADGNAADLFIGDADSYEFIAVLPEKENAVFEAYVTDALFNMTYYAHFGYNFYVPVSEGVTVTKVGNATSFGKVLVYGKQYYVCNVGYPDSTSAISDSRVYVNFTADGVNYSVPFYINALLYANLAIADPMANQYDKEAVGCLVRYLHESYKAKDADGVLDDETEAKFTAFYDIYTPAPYVTEYPTSAVQTFNEAAVDGLVESVRFGLQSSRVSLIITLTDAAKEAGYYVYFNGGLAYGKAYSASSGKVWYSNNTPLANYLMSNKYTVEIRDASGKVVVRDLDEDGTAETQAKFNYSIATYISIMEDKGENVDLMKSLYALGKAVAEVRKNIY